MQIFETCIILEYFHISVKCYNHCDAFFPLGTPDESVWPGVSQLPDFKSSFPKWPQQSISSIVPHLTGEGLDLMAVSCAYLQLKAQMSSLDEICPKSVSRHLLTIHICNCFSRTTSAILVFLVSKHP